MAEFGYQGDGSIQSQLAHAREVRAKRNAGEVSTGKTVGGALGGIAGLVAGIYTGQPELVAAGIGAGSAIGGYAAGSGDDENAAGAGASLAELAAKRYAAGGVGEGVGAGAADLAEAGMNYA